MVPTGQARRPRTHAEERAEGVGNPTPLFEARGNVEHERFDIHVKLARNARHYNGVKGPTLSITARLRDAMGHLMEKAMETQLSPGFVASAGRVSPRALMQV